MRIPHPIPYQGSKRRLAPVIGSYIPGNTRVFYEPFAGSAAMTIHAARNNCASRFVVADSLEAIVELLRAIVEEPEGTADRYRKVWQGHRKGGDDYFNRVRERYNRGHDPVDLLYLICRCVKNSIRFSSAGNFTQSADRRRLGMHPDKMQGEIVGASSILRGRTEFRVGDWKDTSADARPGDFIYMDPPYLGTSVGRDRRYYQQLAQQELVAGLEGICLRNVPFALSYDGMTGGRTYGPPLPGKLGLRRLLLAAGISSQATLSGRREETIESLYVTPGLVKSRNDMACLKQGRGHLFFR